MNISTNQQPDTCIKHQYTALIIASLTIITAGTFTTLAGLLTTQFTSELGWSTASISSGVALNMILYGAVAPFAIFTMEKYGIRRITILALCLLITGALLPLTKSITIFNFAWGVIVGIGCGSLTMAYGALIARIWFKRTGLATGILTASAVLGQFILLPLWAEVAARFGWQYVLAGCATLSFITLLLNIIFLTDKHTNITTVSRNSISKKEGIAEVLDIFKGVLQTKVFWLIALAFAICGATTNGLMWSSFTPAAAEFDLDVSSASTILLLIGLFNVPGTIFSGWISDRVNERLVLYFVFAARGATLLWLPLILTNNLSGSLIIFGILFGVFDVATVPPVINLCNKVFGEKGPSVFSWINVFHQVGAGFISLAANGLNTLNGTYQGIWFFAAILCFAAIIIVYFESINSKKESKSISAAQLKL